MRLAAWMLLAGLTVGLAGCRTTHFTARNLPPEFHIPPAPASAGINLARMAGAGVGTSQIEPGDLVEITLLSGSGDESATPLPARIADDGTVMVPLVGAVPIGGLEPTAAEKRIAAAAVQRGIYRQPHVTVAIAERAVNKVTVLGAVAQPGVVELPRGSCDLASALAAAGGLTKEASTRVEILHRQDSALLHAAHDPMSADSRQPTADSRQPGAVQPASYTEGVPFGAPALDYPSDPSAWAVADYSAATLHIDLGDTGPAAPQHHKLNDRDIVMVLPERPRVIHVTGLVVRPDQFELPRDKDIRVLDAVAMAGGTASPLADKVFVIRHLPERPQPAVIKVSLSRAKRHGEENLRLAAGDLVSVESTPATMALDTVTRFFRVGLGVSGNLAAF